MLEMTGKKQNETGSDDAARNPPKIEGASNGRRGRYAPKKVHVLLRRKGGRYGVAGSGGCVKMKDGLSCGWSGSFLFLVYQEIITQTLTLL